MLLLHESEMSRTKSKCQGVMQTNKNFKEFHEQSQNAKNKVGPLVRHIHLRSD